MTELLQQAGHDVTRPRDAGLDGAEDDVHFRYAVSHGLAILTKNPPDFEALHLQYPVHPGVLAVCQDNDPNRDMTDPEIVRAIGNLELAAASGGNPIAGFFHILNNWRY